MPDPTLCFWKKREMVYGDEEAREKETEGVYIPIPQSLADSALFTARHVTAHKMRRSKNSCVEHHHRIYHPH
jgi:hypothetical protein